MESESKTNLTSLVEDEDKLHMEIELINPAIENISINPIFIKETENKPAQNFNNETNVDIIQRPNITNNTNEMSIDHAPNVDVSILSMFLINII